MYLEHNDTRIFDVIVGGVKEVALPEFWLSETSQTGTLSDREILRMIAEKRAYSAARAKLVEKMLNYGSLDRAFASFEISKVMEMRQEDVLERSWPSIRAIRFKWKVGEIIGAANSINEISCEFGSFSCYLHSVGLPRPIKQPSDIDAFWIDFDRLLADLQRRRVPVLRNEITLLHFLESDLQLDCIKPDTIVMKVMNSTGIVSAKMKGANRLAVKKVQEYCLQKGFRPQQMDRYLLAFGGQSWAKDVVLKSFCISPLECDPRTCPVGKDKLCPTADRGLRYYRRD